MGPSAGESPADAGSDGEAESVDVVADVVVDVVVSVAVAGSDGSGDELSAEDDESVSSARATPGMLVVNPTPTPSATASAPTRPMNLEYPCKPRRAVGCCRG